MISETIRILSQLLITTDDNNALKTMPALPEAFGEALAPLLPDGWEIKLHEAGKYEKGLTFVYDLHRQGLGQDCIRFSIRFDRLDNFVAGTMEYLAGSRKKSKFVSCRNMRLPDVVSSDDLSSWMFDVCSNSKGSRRRPYTVTFGMLSHYTVTVNATSEDEAITLARKIDLTDRTPDDMDETDVQAEAVEK